MNSRKKNHMLFNFNFELSYHNIKGYSINICSEIYKYWARNVPQWYSACLATDKALNSIPLMEKIKEMILIFLKIHNFKKLIKKQELTHCVYEHYKFIFRSFILITLKNITDLC